VITLVIDEHLRLVFESPKSARMNDPISISLEEIRDLRREMWKNFPREDI